MISTARLLLPVTLLFLANVSCTSGNSTKKPSPSINENKNTLAQDTMRNNEETLEYLMGKFDPSTEANFSRIPEEYADRSGLYLREEALQAYTGMAEAAKEDGIELIIRSATRNFDYQKGIWERKWKEREEAFPLPIERAEDILLYSSMPGTSRHHWGSDVDLNAFENSYFTQGEGLEIYSWLKAHAAEYGFCQPYQSKDSGRSGYQEEKWHWSYMPIAGACTHFAKEKLQDKMITGFLGSDVADSLDIVQNYILGIACPME